jgi:hypothetical protein
VYRTDNDFLDFSSRPRDLLLDDTANFSTAELVVDHFYLLVVIIFSHHATIVRLPNLRLKRFESALDRLLYFLRQTDHLIPLEPVEIGPVTTAVFDDTCGNLIQIAQR